METNFTNRKRLLIQAFPLPEKYRAVSRLIRKEEDGFGWGGKELASESRISIKEMSTSSKEYFLSHDNMTEEVKDYCHKWDRRSGNSGKLAAIIYTVLRMLCKDNKELEKR